MTTFSIRRGWSNSRDKEDIGVDRVCFLKDISPKGHAIELKTIVILMPSPNLMRIEAGYWQVKC